MGLRCESYTEPCAGASCAAVAILKFLKFEQRALHLILYQACSCVAGPDPSYVGGSGCRSKGIRKSSVREVWLGRGAQNWAGAPQGCSRPGVRSGAACVPAQDLPVGRAGVQDLEFGSRRVPMCEEAVWGLVCLWAEERVHASPGRPRRAP